MRKTASLLTAVPVIASLVCASAVTAHAAPAAPRARAAAATAAAQAAAPLPVGWRIVASFPVGTSVDKLAASGPDSAWAVEPCRKPCKSGNGVILRHWNGKSWQAQPQPALAKHTGDAEPQLAIAPGSKDVWAVYNIYDGKVRGSAAEWTGKSWGRATLFPAHVTFTAVVAAGPSDVWAFGLAEAGPQQQYAARYNGRTWSKAALPGPALGIWTATARSVSDIWAQAIAANGFGLTVSRWNGTRWVKQPAPAAPNKADGVSGGPIVVSGRSGVWGYGYFSLGGSSRTDWLVHFDGASWSRVRNPYQLSARVVTGPLGPDGHGGAWIAAIPANSTTEYLYHVSAAGHWLKLPIRAPKGAHGTTIAGFAAIPGSTSVYAYGEATASGGQTEGVILKYVS